ncbi:MAG: DUF3833 domain-containing protein [Methyloversatilis sp.]|uniref:DUF3833 domain-containing protein n=1 Tax=Methyloversatilis sp. TaxID=2569862 RepID=UPI0025D9AE2C|nr:DUF3833 domain-containing protein [Methyloversatilis sp.]MCR6667269.1 DUF3833 domain-containing protein [Methyloversatilis sp.]
MKKMLCRLLSVLGLAALAGCGGVPVEKYAAQKPVLDLKQYFNGPVTGWGMFQDRSGEVIKRFAVRIDARWQGDTGTLDERFEWSDGTQSRRVWTIRHLGDGRYSGRADDVVGEATGEASGNALRWRYVLALPVDDKVYNVDFDDWMYLIDDKVMLNRSAMSKFGVHLGEVTLSFTRGAP